MRVFSNYERRAVLYWQDKLVLVTGGSAGFGEVLCRQLIQYRATVLPVARHRDRLQSAVVRWRAPENLVFPAEADVTRDEDVQRLVEWVRKQFGRLDALIHVAGQSDRGYLLETSLQRFQQLWELNALAAVRLAQSFWPFLRASRGHLVLIGSLASKCAARYLGAYPASKFALAGIAQQLRLEGQTDGVHTLLVCPGPMARDDAGHRYDEQAHGLPPAARKPGAGVRLKGIDPQRLAVKLLQYCQERRPELVMPGRARLLFALLQLFPTWGERLVARFTSG